MIAKRSFLKDAVLMKRRFVRIASRWDGKDAILQMKRESYNHWKQMEWIGFYFQFLCEKNLVGHMKIQHPKYGRTSFDALGNLPWDFKAHANNTSSHEIIANDLEATLMGIKEFGAVGLVLALGEVKYNDVNRSFQKWHTKLKGGKSRYEMERIQRGAWSRLRKVSFNLQQIAFILIDKKTLEKSGSFQKNFRNSNGSPRRGKVLINLETLSKDSVVLWGR